jgi:membrane-associated phospholipid phosphatase
MEEVRAAPLRTRTSALRLGIVSASAAFVLLALLVSAGRLHELDQYAVDHWMPGLERGSASRTVPPFTGIFMPVDDLDISWWQVPLELMMYPASALVSFAVFALGSYVLWRRGARVAAVVWFATWFVANAIEVGLKIGIEKPELYLTDEVPPYHLKAYDHSFPSGHALRSVMVAAIVFYVWRRFGRALAAWVAASAVALVIGSWHVPSDVVGGVLFGVLVVLVTVATTAALAARR